MYSELMKNLAEIRAENTAQLAKYERMIKQNEPEDIEKELETAVSGPHTKRIIPIVKNSGNTTRFTS